MSHTVACMWVPLLCPEAVDYSHKPLQIGVQSATRSPLAWMGLGIYRNSMYPVQDTLQPWIAMTPASAGESLVP